MHRLRQHITAFVSFLLVSLFFGANVCCDDAGSHDESDAGCCMTLASASADAAHHPSQHDPESGVHHCACICHTHAVPGGAVLTTVALPFIILMHDIPQPLPDVPARSFLRPPLSA